MLFRIFPTPVTLTVHPNLIDQILRTQPTGLRGLDSTSAVPISGLQGSVSLRPWVDADALERGDGLESPTIGTNRNSRLGRFINRNVFRTQDTSNLVIDFLVDLRGLAEAEIDAEVEALFFLGEEDELVVFADANTPQAILRLLSRLRQGLRTMVFAPFGSPTTPYSVSS
ncbi:hypothetical protein K435DRAFT_868078 [Dendrothele bispora CBS 962.96]|uniref:Uncharacterized protein n=1 Tax=Dendrothele bispora (strain CBS 962.96) TaxID=1314807 RepID=A0A4S8LD27_DENBC|nr:hypothetical protein K435DRAFT_868078 [Dendrothele bispora CBS 962.96]